MKKSGILNSHISKVLSDLGHTDKIVIADCGLPIPESVLKIDLAVALGNPNFITVLEEVLKDIKVESVYLAVEIKENNKFIHDEVLNVIDNDIKVNYISHEELKKELKNVRAIIRTGENTPYANIILESGVIF